MALRATTLRYDAGSLGFTAEEVSWFEGVSACMRAHTLKPGSPPR